MYPANNIIFYFRISAYHLYFLFHYLLFVFLFFKYKDNKFYTPQVLYYLVLILSLTSGIVGFSISMVSFFIMTTYKIYKKKFYKLDGLFAFIILLIIPTLLYKYLNHPYTNMPGRLNYEFFSLIQTFCKIFYNFVNIILSNNISNIIANKKINLEFYNYILVFCYLVIFFNYYFFNILIKKHFFLLKKSCLFFFFIVSLVINASNVLLSHKWHFVLMAYFFFMHLYVFLFRITFWKNIFIKGLILSSLICLLFLFINGQIKERKKHYNILKSVDQLVQNINNFNFKSNSLIIYKNPIPYSGLSENFRLKSLIYNFINLKNNPTNVRFENYKKDILILNNNKFKNFYIIDGKLGNKIFLQN